MINLKQRDDVAVILADQDGIITFVNATAERILGWRPADLVGQPITVLIPPRYRDAHNLGFARFLRTGKATLHNRTLYLTALHRDGHEFPAEHQIFAERQGTEWVFGATIRPRETR